jgi:hypothetical protein
VLEAKQAADVAPVNYLAMEEMVAKLQGLATVLQLR